MRRRRKLIFFASILQLATALYLLSFTQLQEQQIVTRLELFIQPPLSQADRDVGRFIEPNQKARANVTFLLEPMTESEFKGCGRCATNDVKKQNVNPSVLCKNLTRSQVRSVAETATKACRAKQKIKKIRWRMVFFVKSELGNTEKRKKIRQTWGAIRQVNRASLETVFVVGEQNSSEVKLKPESVIYEDILQYRGPDDYSNIARKTLAGMQWAADHLPEHFLFSSVDDDFFIDMKAFVNGVDWQFIEQRNNSWPEFPIFCGFVKGVGEKPVRIGQKDFQKWAISKEMYRWPTFPPYCHGGLYTTSVRVVKQLYNLSRYRKLWFLDDVWITGILRRELGMPDEMVTHDKCPTGYHLSSDPANNWRWDVCKKPNSKEKKKFELLLEDKSFCKSSNHVAT